MMELRICHLYPDVLNLYGDRGNILCMRRRLEWRGISCSVTELPLGVKDDLTGYDLFFIGGVLFMISDLILNGTYFGEGKERPVDIATNYLTYYSAQFLIASSLMFLK